MVCVVLSVSVEAGNGASCLSCILLVTDDNTRSFQPTCCDTRPRAPSSNTTACPGESVEVRNCLTLQCGQIMFRIIPLGWLNEL